MKIIQGVGKMCLVSFTYLFLLFISKIVQFWVLAQQLTMEELSEGYWSWAGKKGEWLFWGCFGQGLPIVFIITLLLFGIFHSKDFEPKRIKQISRISKEYWRSILIQAAVLIGSLFGIIWFGVDRFSTEFSNHIISPRDIYFFLSGTTIFKNSQMQDEAVRVLNVLAECFAAHTDLMEFDLFNMFVAYCVYQFLQNDLSRT